MEESNYSVSSVMWIQVVITSSSSVFPINMTKPSKSPYSQAFWVSTLSKSLNVPLYHKVADISLLFSASLQNSREEQKQRGELVFPAAACLGHSMFDHQVSCKLEEKSQEKRNWISFCLEVGKEVSCLELIRKLTFCVCLLFMVTCSFGCRKID